jgi:multicomponent Na+:H+ antiporter subunit G
MTWEMAVQILSWGFILSGSAFTITGGIGILRFPDFWSRMHAASVTDSAGMILLVLGMCLQAGLTLITVKLLIIAAFIFITGSTATHAVANAALVSGAKPDSDEDDRNAEKGNG